MLFIDFIYNLCYKIKMILLFNSRILQVYRILSLCHYIITIKFDIYTNINANKYIIKTM